MSSVFRFFYVLLSFYTVHDDWVIHVSSGLLANSGRKRATVACYIPTSLFRGLYLSSLACAKCQNCRWTQANDRAETFEVMEERLHEIEAEVKELRVDSCWTVRYAAIRLAHWVFWLC